MLLAIPYQTLEVGKVHIDSFRPDRKGRPLAPLTYKDASVDIGDLTILTPELPVVRYDTLRAPGTERIVLDVTGTPVFQTKINTLQEYIAASLYLHRMTFFGKELSAEEVKAMLQPLLIGPHLNLYTYTPAPAPTHTPTHTPLERVKVPEKVRALLRIHGVLKFDGRGGLQLRIQHSVPKIWTVGA
jgi:hypothetical protein